jgi:hypothetical protein
MDQIRKALEGTDGLDHVDWDNPDEVWEVVAGDGEGGEGVEYRQGEAEGEISFTKTWGIWVLSEGYTKGERHPDPKYWTIWHHTFTVHPNRAAAKAAYIAAINAKRAEGVHWEPDYCPIFNKLQACW